MVWLTMEDHKSFGGKNLDRFGEFGVRFQLCDDLKSHKKWLPMIEDGHRDPFVICDDDIIYPREWFESLVTEDRPDAYVGGKCHWIVFDPKEALLLIRLGKSRFKLTATLPIMFL